VVRALRKGQAAIFNITRDIHGEGRIVERAFGIGPCALTETVTVIGETLSLSRLDVSVGISPSTSGIYNRAQFLIVMVNAAQL
jgi:hypothetical protein